MLEPAWKAWVRATQYNADIAYDEAVKSDPWLQDLDKLKIAIREKREARKSASCEAK